MARGQESLHYRARTVTRTTLYWRAIIIHRGTVNAPDAALLAPALVCVGSKTLRSVTAFAAQASEGVATRPICYKPLMHREESIVMVDKQVSTMTGGTCLQPGQLCFRSLQRDPFSPATRHLLSPSVFSQSNVQVHQLLVARSRRRLCQQALPLQQQAAGPSGHSGSVLLPRVAGCHGAREAAAAPVLSLGRRSRPGWRPRSPAACTAYPGQRRCRRAAGRPCQRRPRGTRIAPLPLPGSARLRQTLAPGRLAGMCAGCHLSCSHTYEIACKSTQIDDTQICAGASDGAQGMGRVCWGQGTPAISTPL